MEGLRYKVTHRSGGEESEIHGRYLGTAPSSAEHLRGGHLFAVEGLAEPVMIHPEDVVDYFEATPPMPFPR